MYFKNGAYILGSLCCLPSLVSAPPSPGETTPLFSSGEAAFFPVLRLPGLVGLSPGPALNNGPPSTAVKAKEIRGDYSFGGDSAETRAEPHFLPVTGEQSMGGLQVTQPFPTERGLPRFQGCHVEPKKGGAWTWGPELLLTSDSSGLFSYRSQNTTLAWSFL